MDKQKLLEALRSYAMPTEFKDNPDYVLDHARYKRIGPVGKGGGSKPLGNNDVGGLFVKAHWNTRHGMYSIKPPHDKSTLGHAASVHLGGPDGVRFDIDESGRKQSLKLGQRTPHAYVSGIVQKIGATDDDIPEGAVPLGYSARGGHFFQVSRDGGGKPIAGAQVDHAHEVVMLPPHPDALKAHADKVKAAQDAGENMFSWHGKNKAPIGRVYARLHEKDGEK